MIPEQLGNDLRDVLDLCSKLLCHLLLWRTIGKEAGVLLDRRAATSRVDGNNVASGFFERLDVAQRHARRRLCMTVVHMQSTAAALRTRDNHLTPERRENPHGCPVDLAEENGHNAALDNAHAHLLLPLGGRVLRQTHRAQAGVPPKIQVAALPRSANYCTHDAPGRLRLLSKQTVRQGGEEEGGGQQA